MLEDNLNYETLKAENFTNEDFILFEQIVWNKAYLHFEEQPTFLDNIKNGLFNDAQKLQIDYADLKREEFRRYQGAMWHTFAEEYALQLNECKVFDKIKGKGNDCRNYNK